MSGVAAARYLIGQVAERSAMNPNFLKVTVQKMKLDKNLLMYFPYQLDKWAVDNKCKAQIGDIVLLKSLPEKLTPEIKTEIDSIVFKQGSLVDPVTGRACRGTEYIDVKEREEEKLRRDIKEMKIRRQKLVEVSEKPTES